MTPTETAAVLRQYNQWRRGNLEGMPQPDPREIGEAIDAAVEMIERLEAAEKSDAESLAMYRKARDERDALRAALQHEADCVESAKAEIEALCAKVEAMVRQEPVAWARKLGLDVPSFGCVTDLKYRPSNIPESSYIPLYALPGAQPAPSAPDVDALAQFIREIDGKHQLGAGALAERIVEWLAAAPEVKP